MDREMDKKAGGQMLTCGIVRDLLPSYQEEITSPVTARRIAEHLKTCEACREALAGFCRQQEREEQEERVRGRNFQEKLLSVKYQLLGFLAGLLVPVAGLLLPIALSLVLGRLFELL